MDQKQIKLSDNILIQCPERMFELRRAKLCFSCEYYRGIMKSTERGEIVETSNADDFQILCGRPITRKLTQLVDD